MPLPVDVKARLQSYQLLATQRLSQNFLKDERLAERIVNAAEICPSDAVLEIGTGLGILTHALAKKAAKVITFEKDKKLLGGSVFEEFDDRIVFRAFASLIEYQDLRINDFQYWNSIKYAKSKGKTKVDLGGYQIKARGHLVGINTFKEKWGGKIVYYYIYSKNPLYILGRKAIRNSSIARWIWDRIKRRPIPRKDKNAINKKSYETKSSVDHFDLGLKGLFQSEKLIIDKYLRKNIGFGLWTRPLLISVCQERILSNWTRLFQRNDQKSKNSRKCL